LGARSWSGFVTSGATVEIWDVDGSLADEAARAIGPAVTGRAVDVTDAAAVEAAAGAHERVDILVCSAGIAGPNARTWEYPLDAWARVMRINVDGVFHCCRAVVPLMLRHGYGRIVNIASVAGKEGNPNASAYSASKAAVIGLTKSLGKELADKDIAVNCITPAAARTRIFEQMSEEHIAFMLSKIPRGRFLEVDEGRGPGGVARLRGELLHHRRRLRHLRRSRNLLSPGPMDISSRCRCGRVTAPIGGRATS
jgi:3-oxoacyl-[acyl-carrier protein] reductase